jgi:hypothetical protein
MAEYAFERRFTSSRPPQEVFDEIDDHLIQHLGGKVHYSRARRKYVVQGPSRGIKFGPFMKLKLLFDLMTDHKGSFLIKVKMEKKPSPLLWALFPIGILLTFSGVPLFWMPALYFFADPRSDVEKVVDSFIWKMSTSTVKVDMPGTQMYEAIIIEREDQPVSKAIPEGKVYMAKDQRRLLAMTLGITFVGGTMALLGFQMSRTGQSNAIIFIPLGLLFMILGAIMMIIVLVKMARNS